MISIIIMILIALCLTVFIYLYVKERRKNYNLVLEKAELGRRIQAYETQKKVAERHKLNFKK